MTVIYTVFQMEKVFVITINNFKTYLLVNSHLEMIQRKNKLFSPLVNPSES